MIRAWLAGLLARDRGELTLLLAPITALMLVLAFVLLAGEVFEGDTQAFDDHVLMALRRADNPAVPIGPRWLQAGALDITALGSATVLALVLISVSGFLLLQGKVRTAAFITVATVGGFLLNSGLKLIFQRARPEIVPHLREVVTLSFPSGHAMTAAAVYLTLGALTMRSAHRRVAKFYCMAMAMLVTVLVGASRVFLGVHYPSDVLAGWILGLVWALICWTVERRIEYRAGLKQEQRT